MLINLTNHPYEGWSKEQQEDIVAKCGKVLDMPFPKMDPDWPNEIEKIVELVRTYRDKVIALKPDAVLLMGEWCFTIMLINELLKRGVKVYSTATDLDMQFTHNPDGSIDRVSHIHYRGLRPYHYLKEN